MRARGFLAETLDDPALAEARAAPTGAPPSRREQIFYVVLGVCLLAYPLVFDQPVPGSTFHAKEIPALS